MKLGVVGLPNVGKSTLFNAITQAGAAAANYPFCTIEPNVGVVAVPDERLDTLAAMHKPEKTTPAIVEFADIAGLVAGAHKGEGLGNRFLSHIREVDAIVHVVRCFEDANVVHVDGSVNPSRDVETINLELLFADMETLDKRIDRTAKAAKSGEAKLKHELALLTHIKEDIEKGLPVRAMSFEKNDAAIVDSLFLLTAKPVIYVANVAEDDAANPAASPLVSQLADIAKADNAPMIALCARFEEEISELPEDEKAQFLAEMGLSQSGLDKLVQTSYATLGLISYFTAGPKEVRAWTIKAGTKAPQAAGKIHSDFERGFIRAEVIHYDELMRVGSMATAKEQGLIRSEGKDYVMRDGDIVLFRFNV